MRIAIVICVLLSSWVSLANSTEIPDEVLLALEVSGEMTAPYALAAQIGGDLAACRAVVPRLADIHVRPNWVPGEFILGFDEAGWTRYCAGEHTEVNALNATYGAVEKHRFSIIPYASFASETPWHSGLLAALYVGLPGVTSAEANGIIGDGNDITVTGDRYYVFREGWGDCPSGCIYSHYWEFDLSGGSAVLVDEGGAMVAPVLSTWGSVKSLYR